MTLRLEGDSALITCAGDLLTILAAAKRMIAQSRGGKIIDMASQAGRRGKSLVAVYCATRAAVISLAQSAGMNLIAHGVSVNASRPASSMASAGTMSTQFSPGTMGSNPANRTNRSAPASPSGGWPRPPTSPAWPPFSQVRTPTTSWPKPATWRAGNG